MADQHVLDGRTLDVKRAVPRDQAPAPVRAIWGGTGNGPQKQFSEIKKIFCGGLPPSVAEATFRQYFERFGEVTDAVVMMDRSTGRSRGFGFITFSSEQSLKAVLSQTHELDGKVIDVKRAEPKMPDGGYGGGGGGYGGGGYGGGASYGKS